MRFTRPAFAKSSPASGVTNQPISPTLRWESNSSSASYEYCYDTTNDNVCSSWISNGASTSKVATALTPGLTYYWHVRDIAGSTVYSNGSSTAFWSFTIRNTPTFEDVPYSYWAWAWVERLYAAGITGGCATGPLRYCPDDAVSRAQMAVFLEKGMHGSSFNAPIAPITFGDTAGHWAQYWIEALRSDGITSGCGAGNYCPDYSTTRAEMAVFMLKSKHGSSYWPPAVGASTGFADVPVDHWAAAWIKQLAAEGITSGCGSGNYCPDSPVTRAQMAIFLVRTFNLP